MKLNSPTAANSTAPPTRPSNKIQGDWECPPLSRQAFDKTKKISPTKKGKFKVKKYINSEKLSHNDTYIPSGKEWVPIFEAVKKYAFNRFYTHDKHEVEDAIMDAMAMVMSVHHRFRLRDRLIPLTFGGWVKMVAKQVEFCLWHVQKAKARFSHYLDEISHEVDAAEHLETDDDFTAASIPEYATVSGFKFDTCDSDKVLAEIRRVIKGILRKQNVKDVSVEQFFALLGGESFESVASKHNLSIGALYLKKHKIKTLIRTFRDEFRRSAVLKEAFPFL